MQRGSIHSEIDRFEIVLIILGAKHYLIKCTNNLDSFLV